MLSPAAEAPSAPPLPLPLSSHPDVHAFWAQRWSSGPKLGWHKDDVNPHLEKYSHLLFGDGGDGGDGTDEGEGGGIRIFVPLCGKSVDMAYLASHPKISHVVGIDIVRDAAVDFAREHPQFSMEEEEILVPFSEAASAVAEEEEEEGEKCDDDAKNDDDEGTAGTGTSTFHGKNLTILIRDIFDFLSADGVERAKYVTGGMVPSSETMEEEYPFDVIYDRASIVAIKPSQRSEYASSMGKLLRPGGIVLAVSLDRRKTSTDEARMDGPPYSVDEAEIRRLFEEQEWVESVTLLEEVDDLENEASRERWTKKGVLELYEMVFVIRKKK